jgi:hypothetical protein
MHMVDSKLYQQNTGIGEQIAIWKINGRRRFCAVGC